MPKEFKNLEWMLCEKYFSIVASSSNSNVTFTQLHEASELSKDEIKRVINGNNKNLNFYFLNILISKLDDEALVEFKNDVFEDEISTTYDKILEGIMVRFEKYLPYKAALNILSKSFDIKIVNFLKLFQNNYLFMTNLIDLVEENNSHKVLKSFILNILFSKTMEIYLKDESFDLSRTLKYLDKNLKDIQEIGYITKIIKK